MKKSLISLLSVLCLVFVILLSFPAASCAAHGLVGTWDSGTYTSNGWTNRIVVTFSDSGTGTMTSSVSSTELGQMESKADLANFSFSGTTSGTVSYRITGGTVSYDDFGPQNWDRTDSLSPIDSSMGYSELDGNSVIFALSDGRGGTVDQHFTRIGN